MVYRPGDYYVICDQCGFKKLRSQCKMTWNGLLVCSDTCWEPRHPQDTPHQNRPERQRPRDVRPEGEDTFLDDESEEPQEPEPDPPHVTNPN